MLLLELGGHTQTKLNHDRDRDYGQCAQLHRRCGEARRAGTPKQIIKCTVTVISGGGDVENSMLDSLEEVLFGLVIALPFVSVRRYAVRLLLSVGAPLALYYILIVEALRAHGFCSRHT
jgi:hypothetical protein